ncbi:MAG: hypothetical protein FJY73_14255 [Candidatus Eisenbacteria bacterium]|nr:hypothetical protein [Candidatus Eisenbacteria bacterium]
MNTRVRALLLASILVPSLAPAGERVERVLVPIASRFDPVPWAGNRYATAVATAPAWLAMEERPEIVYGQVQTEGILDEDNLLCVRSRAFGFATESFAWAEERTMRRYTLAVAKRVDRNAAIGIAYTWCASDDDDLDAVDSWDIGLAWKPHPRIDLVANGRNLFRTEFGEFKLGRIYEAGARAALLPNALFVFAEARRFAGDDFGDIIPVFGAEYEPFGFLTLRGRADTESTQGLNIELTYGSSSIGFHYLFRKGEEDGSLAYLKLHVPRR